MIKEKKNKPSKELPLGFVDRQEKELLVRDFIISNIKEIMSWSIWNYKASRILYDR